VTAAKDGLPPLREIVRRFGLAPRKSLGQNFLFDLNLTERIARAAGPLAGVTVLEVGPGPGGLTRALLALGAAHVIAVERDHRAIAALKDIGEHYSGRLEVIEADALTFDPRTASNHSPMRIVANLPFNIATPLLVSWLSVEPWPPWYDCAVLMFQREVAERIVAQPGTKIYGRLSVLAQWRCETQLLFDVNASAFVPPPKVTSTVVRFVPRHAPMPCVRADLEAVTQAAFGQRRKMLRQSLKSLGVDVPALIAQCELDPSARAETLSVDDFVALARGLASHRRDGA
jgi:16S rRNA (adenine1518-N6/adenine1519-N6)-dimethyltransferase